MNLTYIGTATGNGDPYTGLDQFGRVIDHKWVNVSGVAVDEYTYQYDPDGNVLAKANVLDPTLSQTYAYDGLNRLTGDTTNGTADQSWALDALGNMKSTTTGTTTTTRTHDDQNRLTGLGTATLAYDNDGNTTTDEQGRTLTYDAWNRLVVARSGTTSLVRYAYDGLGRRTKAGDTTTYYDTVWQAVEDDDGGGVITASRAWSPAYVDCMIEGDFDRDDGSPVYRLYPTQDANWDVTSVTDVSGNVLARYAYTAYGTRTVLNPTTYVGMADTLGFEQGYQGGTFEATLPALILFRNRMYNTKTMQWEQQDPLGVLYQDGMNISDYLKSNPVNNTDPSGGLVNIWPPVPYVPPKPPQSLVNSLADELERILFGPNASKLGLNDQWTHAKEDVAKLRGLGSLSDCQLQRTMDNDPSFRKAVEDLFHARQPRFGAPEPSFGGSPHISPADLEGMTRSEIQKLAEEKGLIPKGDPAGQDYPRKWSDPVTGDQRLRLDRGHIDPKTGNPYDNPNAAVDHVHGYDPDGNPITVNGDKHIPTKGE